MKFIYITSLQIGKYQINNHKIDFIRGIYINKVSLEPLVPSIKKGYLKVLILLGHMQTQEQLTKLYRLSIDDHITLND